MTVQYRQAVLRHRGVRPLDAGAASCLNVLDTVHGFRDAQAIATEPHGPGANGPGDRDVAPLSRAGGGAAGRGDSPRPGYLDRGRSMPGVLDFFTVAHETLEDCLDEMIETTHA